MSNLLEKASILLTPTAYDDGKILSVKPEPILGSELVTNGDFATDSNWTKGTGWSISGGVANCDGTNAALLFQSLSGTTTNDTFKVTYTISNYISGSVFVGFGSGLSQPNGTTRNANGTYTEYLTKTSVSTSFGFKSISFIGSIDNVSVKQEIDGDFDFTRNSSATRVNSQGLIEDVQILSSNLVSNGDFSQEGSEQITNGDFSNGSTDWFNPDNTATFSNDSVTISGGSGNRRILQANVTSPTSSQWKLQYEITEKVGTSDLRAYTTSGYSIIPSTVGIHTYYFNSNLTSFYFNFSNSTGSITIDNVSVKEVGQDWTVSNGTITDKYNASMTAYQTGIRILPFSNTGTFKVVFDLVVTSGSCYFDGGSGYNVFSTSGTKELIVTNITKFEFNAFNLGWVGTLDNVSVIEITDDTNLPRIDYTGGEGHWLFEPQSTNLITQSQLLNSALNLKVDTTITDNYGVSPTGEVNSSRIQFADTTAFCYAAVSVSTDHTASVSVKGVSGETVSFGIGANVTTGGLFTFNGLWQRINFTASSAAQIFFSSYSGATTSDFEAFGLQLEAQSFATSYIPTNGSTVTRLQDAAFGAGSSDLINSTEGVLYAEIATLEAAAGTQVLGLSDGSGSNRIGFQTGTSANQLRFVVDSGGNQASYWHVLSDITDFNKVALKWKQDDFSFWVNGVKVATDINGNVPAQNILNTLDFYYASGSGIYNFFGKTKCLAVFKEALTDAELTCLTTI